MAPRQATAKTSKTAKTARTAKPSRPRVRVPVARMRRNGGEVNVSTARAKEMLGGAFPTVNGRKYKYPPPSDETRWTALVNRALAMKARDDAALAKGRSPPVCVMRRQYEYVLYHCNPRSRWKRCQRTAHRVAHGLKVGDPRVVHHHDQRHMSFAKSEVLTPCEHMQVHGRSCGPKSTGGSSRASYARIVNCVQCKNGKCKPCKSKR